MKKVVFAIIMLLFISVMAVAQNTKLKFRKINDNVYTYTNYHLFSGSPFPSNSSYLVTDDGVVLFDTPWDETQFQPLLDSIEKRHGKKVVLCIATHFHDDSSAGLEYYRSKGIKTYTSKFTKELAEKHNAKQAEFIFENDTVFTIGGQRIETFYPGEGHSYDNIVIWLPKDKFLFGGCFLKSVESDNLGNLSDANVSAWDESLIKLMKKFPKPMYVETGHFKGSKGWKAVKHTLKLVKDYKPD
ncbi:BlaB/IND/MUS family subclass B1 metallo-beta-lactamase [Flavobacterium suzhouense]|uniref:beta-lactamase n=1 Tax=Flavobacterium suzhouense TaxID=1529638 RepID=A0ABW5NQE0_9FLAO